jgi:hypothetical protein
MININVIQGQFCEVVDIFTFHLETIDGVLLISVLQYTINDLTFENSTEAVNYILAL